jgi:cyclopropane-fatty-acyl-phospholipid synthase
LMCLLSMFSLDRPVGTSVFMVADQGESNGMTIRLPEVPPVRFRAMLARGIARRAERRLGVKIVSGESAAGDASALVLRRPESFYRRMGADGLIGFGEAFQAGDWETADLARTLTVLVAGMDRIMPRPLQRIRGHRAAPRPSEAEEQTVDGAQRNARHHYGLPDELFRAFLDETMCYSSAIYLTASDGHPVANDDTLADAQRRKIDRLLDLAAVGEDTRLLEIGTGWGELAVRAAQRGAYVHTVTNMVEHAAMAKARVAAAGLSDRIQIDLADYREIRADVGSFDAIVSVEMIEAVGRDYWPTFFMKLESLLAPGGRIGLQNMVMPHDRMRRTSNTYTWTNKYIFPGGLLPSVEAIEQTLARHTGLTVVDRFSFGAHYAATLALWRARFNRNWDYVASLGFDEVFRRTWNFYLAISEAGFSTGYLNVYQFLLGRSGDHHP